MFEDRKSSLEFFEKLFRNRGIVSGGPTPFDERPLSGDNTSALDYMPKCLFKLSLVGHNSRSLLK